MGQPQTILSAPYSFLTQSEEPESLFETVIAQAVDDALSDLGNTKQAIYCHLKNNYGINKKEIPRKIEDFTMAIEQIFGPVAKLIEIKIMKRLHVKYEAFLYTPKKGELNFVEFVYNLQRHLELEG